MDYPPSLKTYPPSQQEQRSYERLRSRSGQAAVLKRRASASSITPYLAPTPISLAKAQQIVNKVEVSHATSAKSQRAVPPTCRHLPSATPPRNEYPLLSVALTLTLPPRVQVHHPYGTPTTAGRSSRLPRDAGRAPPPGGVSPSGAPPLRGPN